MRRIVMVAAAGLLAGCGGEAEQPKEAPKAKAAALQPGEYEVAIKVDAIKSTDDTTPASKAKAGDAPITRRTCVPADGKLEPKLFAEASESCAPMDNYMRSGRMSLQYKCSGSKGQMTQLVDGDFTADSFDAKVTTATYFAGSGDYELQRSYTAKRVGDCAAKPS